ncbi:MAG: hypothetical protein GF400_00910 [Candidatus Eisenbacteria bacterium]|nr:hypothetical protein [Candidatus Eisenbacteria bacterium]
MNRQSTRSAPVFAAAIIACAALPAFVGCAGDSPTEPDYTGGATYLVDPEGGGDFTAIQPALSAAVTGDTVRVLAGTYAGASNRDLDFGGADVVLLAVAARGSVVIDCEGEGRGFYLHNGETRDAVIDGLIVKNGSAYRGGGAQFDGASPTIRNTVFESNEAGLDGGGVYMRNGAAPSFADVTFEDNTADFSGGGLKSDPDCSPELTRVDFVGNYAASGAGASFIFSDGATLFEVTFVGNESISSGGGLYCGNSDVALDEATFLQNSATDGGAIALSGSSPSISHVTIANNQSGDGGGIYCDYGSSPVVRTTVMAFNLGEGSVYCADEASQPNTANCLIYPDLVSNIPCGDSEDNLYGDPLFCGLPGGDVSLCANSPCLPGGNAWGLRVGDRGQGCGECGSTRLPTDLEPVGRATGLARRGMPSLQLHGPKKLMGRYQGDVQVK